MIDNLTARTTVMRIVQHPDMTFAHTIHAPIFPILVLIHPNQTIPEQRSTQPIGGSQSKLSLTDLSPPIAAAALLQQERESEDKRPPCAARRFAAGRAQNADFDSVNILCSATMPAALAVCA